METNEKKALAQRGCSGIRDELVPTADAYVICLASEVFQAAVDGYCM